VAAILINFALSVTWEPTPKALSQLDIESMREASWDLRTLLQDDQGYVLCLMHESGGGRRDPLWQ
jgi:hypothetical protein